jgi:SAM-dependent methyltransferase
MGQRGARHDHGVGVALPMISPSLSGWLALREDADAAARSDILNRHVRGLVSRSRLLRILDLGAGTGSNLRYLAPRLPGDQEWLLVDRDPGLLEEALRRKPGLDGGRSCAVDTACLDLGKLDAPGIFTGRHLVTASALLDLVSESWLRALADRCCSADAAVLIALTYTGQSRCSPAEPEDEQVLQLMNRHQHTDKGLGGQAAGPDAVDRAERAFSDVNYLVRRERSDWTLSHHQGELQRQLIEGWAQAALEMAPDKTSAIHDWLGRRLVHVDSGRSQIVVSHEDLAAWPRDGLYWARAVN